MNHANDNKELRFLSVCSGIEAASVAWHELNWKAVAFSEIEKFPSAVLAHHYPDVPNLGDFTKINPATLGRVDILCGGTPCQAFSVAGLRQSLADARGNLSLEFVRLAHELADGNGLRNVVWENVVGVLSTKDNAFGCFLAGLVGADSAIEPPARGKWGSAGLVSGPKGRAAWRIQDAQFHGLAQRRRRVLVVADFGNGADPAEVLFEREGVQRHSPPSRKEGKDVAPTISARTKGSGGLGTDFDLDGGLRVETFDKQSNCEYGTADVASAMMARDYKSPTDLVAISVTGDIAHTLKAEGAEHGEDGTGRGTPIIAWTREVAGYMVPVTTSAVRRLTPTECERLQGFPDGYTDIPWRGKPNSPDGPRYKALGNSWAVPKFTWLGRRIQMLMPTNDNYQDTPNSRSVSHA